MSSIRSKKRPPSRRAARHPSSADRTWPRCRYPVGLGANRVTVDPAPAGASDIGIRPGLGCSAASDIGETASMMPALSGPSRPPASGGKPSRLVILLHGLGADGNDLIGLAPYWARLLPTTEFLSPNAPFPCDMAPYGYQWYSSQDRSSEAALAGVRAAAPILDAFIDEALARRGREERDLALVGFSQGTVMSLYVGLRRDKHLAGIVGYSGRLLLPICWRANCARTPKPFSFTAPMTLSFPTPRSPKPKPPSSLPAFRWRRLPPSGSVTRSTRRACAAAGSFCGTYSTG